MSTLVLVIAGDQLARDIVGANPAALLSAATGKSVKLIDLSDPNRIRSGSHIGVHKTAEYFRRELSGYEIKINRELDPLSEWQAAGIWWFLGVSDALLYAEALEEGGYTELLDVFEGELDSILSWNPFTVDAKTFVSYVPRWPVILKTPLPVRASQAINSRISSVGDSLGSIIVGTAYGLSMTDVQYRSGNRDHGFTSSGALEVANAFVNATVENLGGSGSGGGGSHVVPVIETTTTYTEYSQTITRNKLAGLEGKKVVVLADGKAIYGLTVGEDGTLTLPFPANKVIVGLPYDSVLAPMPLDTDNNEGSTLGKHRAFGRCVARVYRSFGGEYAASKEGNLYDVNSWTILDRYNIPVLNADEARLVSGDIEFIVPSGQDPDSTIWIIHNAPYPFRLVSLMAEVDFGEQ